MQGKLNHPLNKFTTCGRGNLIQTSRMVQPELCFFVAKVSNDCCAKNLLVQARLLLQSFEPTAAQRSIKHVIENYPQTAADLCCVALLR